MILAVGLTPAWQQILEFEAFAPGEVNRAQTAHWCASGKVANVGVALAHLGGPNLTISPFGGTSGRAAVDELRQIGVPLRAVETAAATRVCTTILDRASHRATELVENARPLTNEELDAYIAAWREAASGATFAVLSGSLPEGTPPGFYRLLMELAPATSFVLDARGPELIEALPRRPLVVKPNVEELGRTVGRSLGSDSDIWNAMGELVERGATWVVVSQGAAPVRVLSRGERLRCVPPEVESVNPIGCGDCLAAGIAWRLQAGAGMAEAVRYGVAAAADNLSQLLPARLDRARIDALLPRVAIVE